MPPPRPLPRIRAPPGAAVVHRPPPRGETLKTKLILGASLALLLVATSVSLAFASGDPKGDTNGDKVHVLHVTLRNSQETPLDLGAPGPSVGDRFIVFGDLFRNDKRVGAGGYECVTMLFTPGPDPTGEPEAATDQCVATLSLPKGQITVQGLVDRTRPSAGHAGHHRRHRRLPNRPRRAADLRTKRTGRRAAHAEAHSLTEDQAFRRVTLRRGVTLLQEGRYAFPRKTLVGPVTSVV